MYDFIEGRVALHAATRLVLEVGGLGYELSVPLGAVFAPGQTQRVWTHFAVREDAHTLYGFPDAPSRELFRALLTVNGVGPRMALGVLSGLSHSELIEAIATGDRARLTAVKGVGRKTADQILLDLSDKAKLMVADSRADGSAAPTTSPTGGLSEDAITALISIGYAEKDARKQVERAAAKVGTADLEQLVRAALSSGS